MQRPVTPVVTYNFPQQKDFCGKERISLKFRKVYGEGGFLDKVVNERSLA